MNPREFLNKRPTRNREVRLELTGVTGVGKTTLIPMLRQILSNQGIVIQEADEAILQCHGLSFVKNSKLRSLLIHLLVFPAFVRYGLTPDGQKLIGLALRVTRKTAQNWAIAAYMLRTFFVQMGVHCWLEQRQNRHQTLKWDLIVIDEGTFHIAHTLFVHQDIPPNFEEILEFCHLVPQPELVVWVTANPEKSIQCTLKRGHKRVKSDLASAQKFVEYAYQTFEMLLDSQRICSKLIKIDYSDRDQSDQNTKLAALEIAKEITIFLNQVNN
jgi:thymidylate kinase